MAFFAACWGGWHRNEFRSQPHDNFSRWRQRPPSGEIVERQIFGRFEVEPQEGISQHTLYVSVDRGGEAGHESVRLRYSLLEVAH